MIAAIIGEVIAEEPGRVIMDWRIRTAVHGFADR